MKDIGHATECIGIKINQCGKVIEIDQIKYIEEIIKKFNQSDAKHSKTPSDPNTKLSVNMINEKNYITGHVPYQEAVGVLLYLAQGTRPDIAFAVIDVSRFNSRHSNEHWDAVLRIIRYLAGTKSLKLRYKRENDACDLHAYSDTDWASDVDKRRSCTGFVINWKSQRQAIVALSSTEAEYIALSSTVIHQQLINEIIPNFATNTRVPLAFHRGFSRAYETHRRQTPPYT